MVATAKRVPALARRVKALRVKVGISQTDLAVAAGLSLSIVAAIEQGANTDPRLSTLARIAKALGTTVSDLIGEGALE